MENIFDLKTYKELIIHYLCEDCNKGDSFKVNFYNIKSKIKSEECSHFNFKFIYNREGNKFNYYVSFDCKKCNKDEVKKICEDNTFIPDIHYKCQKCGNGIIHIGLIPTTDNKTNNNNLNKITNLNNYEEDLKQSLKGGIFQEGIDTLEMVNDNKKKKDIYNKSQYLI